MTSAAAAITLSDSDDETAMEKTAAAAAAAHAATPPHTLAALVHPLPKGKAAAAANIDLTGGSFFGFRMDKYISAPGSAPALGAKPESRKRSKNDMAAPDLLGASRLPALSRAKTDEGAQPAKRWKNGSGLVPAAAVAAAASQALQLVVADSSGDDAELISSPRSASSAAAAAAADPQTCVDLTLSDADFADLLNQVEPAAHSHVCTRPSAVDC